MEKLLLVEHPLPLEQFDRVINRVGFFDDRQVFVPEPLHLILHFHRKVIRYADAFVHRAVKSVSQSELYFDAHSISLFLKHVPDGFYQHHLRCAHIGIVPRVFPGGDKRDHAVSLKSLVKLPHLAVKKDKRNGIIVLLLELSDDSLEGCSFVILTDCSFDHYGRH